jgi:hypothetical protein
MAERVVDNPPGGPPGSTLHGGADEFGLVTGFCGWLGLLWTKAWGPPNSTLLALGDGIGLAAGFCGQVGVLWTSGPGPPVARRYASGLTVFLLSRAMHSMWCVIGKASKARSAVKV